MVWECLILNAIKSSGFNSSFKNKAIKSHGSRAVRIKKKILHAPDNN